MHMPRVQGLTGMARVRRWLGKNLFSDPLNTALTIFSLFLLGLLLKSTLPWLLNSV